MRGWRARNQDAVTPTEPGLINYDDYTPPKQPGTLRRRLGRIGLVGAGLAGASVAAWHFYSTSPLGNGMEYGSGTEAEIANTIGSAERGIARTALSGAYHQHKLGDGLVELTGSRRVVGGEETFDVVVGLDKSGKPSSADAKFASQIDTSGPDTTEVGFAGPGFSDWARDNSSRPLAGWMNGSNLNGYLAYATIGLGAGGFQHFDTTGLEGYNYGVPPQDVGPVSTAGTVVDYYNNPML